MVVPAGAGWILVVHDAPFTPGLSVALCDGCARDPVFADSPVMLKKEVRSTDERVSYG